MKIWIENEIAREYVVNTYPQCALIKRYDLPLGVAIAEDGDWRWFADRKDYDNFVWYNIICDGKLSGTGGSFDETNVKWDDPVNHPKHYTSTKVECIDAMAEALGKKAVASFALANCFKYLWRRRDKDNEEQDVQKALWYFDKYKEIINDIS